MASSKASASSAQPTSARMAALLREKNPKVAIYLMATWSRADQIFPAKGAWAGTAVDVMVRNVRSVQAELDAIADAAGMPCVTAAQ